MMWILPFALWMELVAVATSAPAKSAWIEMTYKFDNKTIYWPGANRFQHKLVFKGQKAKFYYSTFDYSASEHGGTHLDSPIHFYANKRTTDEIPLDTLIGPAVVVDMSAKAAKDPDAQLMPSDLQEWERKHGRIPDDVILLLHTGWGKYWPDAQGYLGTASQNTSLLHFPGTHPDAAQWLVDNRKIKLFGIDTASLDYGQSSDFKTHQILFSKNIPGLENVANLDKLPAKGATVFAAPMFIAGGSGGPCRIFATLSKDWTSGVATSSMRGNRLLLGLLLATIINM